jgi:DNA-binding NarL/FixJ family response regulator
MMVEKDPWRHECLTMFLETQGFEMVLERPDAVIVNLCRRSTEAADAVHALKASWPNAKVLAFVNEVGAHTVFPCLVLGVGGILAYDATKKELAAALRAVLHGSLWVPRELLAGWVERVVESGLPGLPFPMAPGSARRDVFTKSEWRVLEKLADGLSNKEIAKASHVSAATVKFHIRKLLRKTGGKDRHGLAQMYRQMASDQEIVRSPALTSPTLALT